MCNFVEKTTILSLTYVTVADTTENDQLFAHAAQLLRR